MRLNHVREILRALKNEEIPRIAMTVAKDPERIRRIVLSPVPSNALQALIVDPPAMTAKTTKTKPIISFQRTLRGLILRELLF